MTTRHTRTTTQTTDSATESKPSVETIKTRIVAALANARKARHHKDCHCRSYSGQYCNATDALWSRAIERELSNLERESAI